MGPRSKCLLYAHLKTEVLLFDHFRTMQHHHHYMYFHTWHFSIAIFFQCVFLSKLHHVHMVAHPTLTNTVPESVGAA